jgi:hypothetical protein
MNTFSLITQSLAASEADEDRNASTLGRDTLLAGRVLLAVQTVVDTLTPPDGGRYVVAFADIGTAATMLGERRIIVSSKPLHDNSLSLTEKAVVIATFAAHEIGHTYITRPRGTVVKDRADAAGFPFSGYHSVANVADDIILEPFMVERYPILADAFDFTGMWVLRSTKPTFPVVRTVEAGQKTADRFNLMLSATRYGDIPEIVFSGERAIEERDAHRDWARRLIALPTTDHAGFIALVDECWHRICQPEPPQVEEPPITCGPTGPGPKPEPKDGEDEGPTQPGDEPSDEDGEDEGKGKGKGEDDDDEPTDEPGDEPGGEDGDGEDGEDDEPTDDGQPGGSKGKDGDQPTPDFGDEDDDEDGEDGDGEPKPDDDGTPKGDGESHGESGDDEDHGTSDGGGDPHADGSDFDENEVDASTHTNATSDDSWEGAQVEKQVREYNGTGSLAFGNHGKVIVHWG